MKNGKSSKFTGQVTYKLGPPIGSTMLASQDLRWPVLTSECVDLIYVRSAEMHPH